MANTPAAAAKPADTPPEVAAPAIAEAAPAVAELPKGHVRIRVLPLGDGKVATGKHDLNTSAPLYHARGDVLIVSDDVGEAQEERGFAEIQR